MAAPLDWAAFSEADEESRQALLKRAVKIEPSLGVVLQSSVKKTRKKSEENASEGALKPKTKRTSSKKTSSVATAAIGSVVAAKKKDMSVGDAEWVTKELEAVGLGAWSERLAALFPLELLVHADNAQLDLLLNTCAQRGHPFPDVIDYIKLQCVIRAMHVKITGTTGNGAPVATALSPERTLPMLHHALLPMPTQKEKDLVAKMLTQGDILAWSHEETKNWLNSLPALARFADSFSAMGIDGHKLLKLNDRTLLQHFKMESETDRALLLRHVADLKALQLTRAASTHSDILAKLIDGLSSELHHLSSAHASKGAMLAADFKSPDVSDADSESSSAMTSTSSSHSLASSASMTSKRVPNYFLSLRIADTELKERVKSIQSEIEARVPELAGSRSMLPPEQLHFTLGRLYLQTEEEIALAKSLLQKCYEAVYQRFYPDGAEVAVTFKGVTNYGGNTVFLETERGNERDLLIEFGNTVYEMFQEAGLTSKEFRFQPVAPIIRVRQSKKPLVVRLQEASEELLHQYSHAQLGRNVFASLDISAVADQTDADGYYKNLHSVSLQ